MLATLLKGASSTPKLPVTVLTSTSLPNQASDASRTLTLSSGFQIGDTLIAMTGNRTFTAPTLLSGYTDIISVANAQMRTFRVQYKQATSNTESITWTGAYGWLMVIRNFRGIGQVNSLNSATQGSTQPLPDLTSLLGDGKSLIIGGSYLSSAYSSTTAPYTLLSTFAVNVEQNTTTSITGTSVTNSNSLVRATYAIELI